MTSRVVERSLATQMSKEGLRSALARWRHRDVFLLAVMVVSIMALDLLWISLDSATPFFDYARHLTDSLTYRSTFTFAHPLRPLQWYAVYPPFVYWLTDFFYAIVGTALWVAILSQVVFLSVLVYATYGIGTTLWNRRVGLLSTLFVVASPMFVTHFKVYMLDAPLTAMVTLALYFLIRSDHFADRRFSLLLGVACGFGLLTKWTFPLCIGLPVAVSVATVIPYSLRARSTQQLLNMAMAGLLAFAISGIWYIHNWSRISLDVSGGLRIGGAFHPVVTSLPSLLWYFWDLIDNQLYLIPFLFFIAGFVVVFLKDESAKKNTPVVLTIVGTYLAFTLLRNKDFRYTMPMLPAVAVVATSWLEYVRPRVRSWLNGGLIAYSVAAFFVISFGTSFLPKRLAIPTPIRPYTSNLLVNFSPESNLTATGIVVFAQHGYVIGKPSSVTLHPEKVFREIERRGGTFAYSGTDSDHYNSWDTGYYQLKYHLRWVVQEEADFLVVHVLGDPQPVTGFERIAEFRLLNGDSLSLYQRA